MTPEQEAERAALLETLSGMADISDVRVSLPAASWLAADADRRALRDRIAALEGAIDAHREATGYAPGFDEANDFDAALYAVRDKREGEG